MWMSNNELLSGESQRCGVHVFNSCYLTHFS